MPIDRDKFFKEARQHPFGGTLNQKQVDGCNSILDQWDIRMSDADIRWLAYMLATTFWETAKTMQPVREAYYLGEPEPAESYRKTLRYYPTYGRGYVQLTWEANYRKQGDRLGIDLVAEPDRALEPPIAADIMFNGMVHGDFTGVGLGRYFNRTTNDPVNARRIINGTDHADEIAAIYGDFLFALT